MYYYFDTVLGGEQKHICMAMAEIIIRTECSRSPYDTPLSPLAVKIMAFGQHMGNYNICQVKYWHCVRNQFSDSFNRRQLRRDIDLTHTS
jgi:hypothetical protein